MASAVLAANNLGLSPRLDPDIDLGLIDHRVLGYRLKQTITGFGKDTNGSGAVTAIVAMAVSCRTAIALGVVLLMTVKSDLTESVVMVVVAVTAGSFPGIVTRNVHRAMRPFGAIEKPEASCTARNGRCRSGDRSTGAGAR